ncbi:Uncharacterised protein [Klebsiella michiganensis]|nr:Uncharacterised protein [Klebsiella michiganensis]
MKWECYLNTVIIDRRRANSIDISNLSPFSQRPFFPQFICDFGHISSRSFRRNSDGYHISFFRPS